MTTDRASADRLTLCEMFQRTVARCGDAAALRAAGREPISWRDYGRRVEAIASGLLGLGLEPGGSVALLTSNIPEFHLADVAVMHAGGVPFSVNADDPLPSLIDRIEVAGTRVIVAEAKHLPKARELASAAGVTRVIALTGDPEGAEIGLAELEGRAVDGEAVRRAWGRLGPDDVATLIFTSGTTGRPKAVQLPHRAITVSLQTFLRVAPGGADGRVLCYLPLSHIAERFMSHYLSVGYGAEISCVADPDDLYNEIVRVRPTRFFGVPRVYAKLADRAHDILAARPDAAVGTELGLDQTHYRGVATAPSSAELLQFFADVGLPVGDIWGMSEAIMCTTNPTGAIKLGTVGRFLDEVEARVADDGELLVRGPNTFVGYVNDPERTAEMRDAEGWIRTGDLGSIDDEGYLTIIGRKKEIMITATGKNVAPAAVEMAILTASPLIDQVFAVGEGRRYITALLALDPAQLVSFARREHLAGSFAELTHHPVVLAEIERAVAVGNARLARAETVRSWWVSPTEWRPGGDELTPTMKLRRAEINEKYAEQIANLYGERASSAQPV